jgi:nitrogen-specific signal transduction histidine kinase
MRRTSVVIELDSKSGVRRIAANFHTTAEQVAAAKLIERISHEIATLSLAAKNAGRQPGSDR